ncbi:MAG: diguanylate cyclase [Clostridiales bacterium]|nr:diguanylate cyclase [Clostridiales bacterium]
MFIGIVQNLCIVITILSFVLVAYKDRDFNPTFLEKTIFGLGGAITGILLIQTGFHVAGAIILDFRNIPIIFAALIGGPISSVIAGVVIGAYLLPFAGISEVSVSSFILAMALGLGCALISFLRIKLNSKSVIMVIFYIVISSVIFYFLSGDRVMYLEMIAAFVVSTLVVCFISNYFYLTVLQYTTDYKHLKKSSTKDFLTGLNNVRQFDNDINMLSEQAERKKERLSLLIVDIDHFKRVNDYYGYAAGDKILKDIANVLVNSCRCYDVVSRNGGEEFSIILIDCPLLLAAEIAERIRRDIEARTFNLSEQLAAGITVSIGVSCYSETTDSTKDLVETADIALYAAKRSGRNRVVQFHDELTLCRDEVGTFPG